MGKASRCREKVVFKHLLGPMEPLSAILYPLRRRVSRPPGAALHLRRALAGATKALVQKCLLNFLSAQTGRRARRRGDVRVASAFGVLAGPVPDRSEERRVGKECRS